VHVLAGTGKITGPLPVADVLVDSAVAFVPRVHGRAAGLQEQCPAALSGYGAEGQWRIGRPERRRSQAFNAGVPQLREHPQCVQVRSLALVGAHPGGGIALEMFDVPVAFPNRQHDIADGGVVVELVEMLFRTLAHRVVAWDGPEGSRGLLLEALGRGCVRRTGGEPRIRRRRGAGLEPLPEAVAEIEAAPAGAGATVGIGDMALAGNEGVDIIVEMQLSPRLAEQVDRRSPAAGYRHHGTTDALHDPLNGVAALVELHDFHSLDGFPVAHAGDRHAGMNGYAGLPGLLHQRPVRARAQVHDFYTGAVPVGVQGGLVGGVIIREHHDLPARQHSVAIDVGPHGPRQHDSRPIIVREHEGALNRACRQHRLFCPDPPQPLAGHIGAGARRLVVRDPLQGNEVIVVVVAGAGGSGQDRDFLQ
jgi:hypothetical protein